MTRKGYEAYKLYLALQRHFSTESYDFFKYHGKVKANVSSYEKRGDMFAFEKVANIIPEDELKTFFIAHFLEDPKMWIKRMSRDTYLSYKNRLSKMSYNFEQDMLKIKEIGPNKVFSTNSSSLTPFIDMTSSGQISLESAVIFGKIYNYMPELEEKLLNMGFVWPEMRLKLQKYAPFIECDLAKYTQIMHKIFS